MVPDDQNSVSVRVGQWFTAEARGKHSVTAFFAALVVLALVALAGRAFGYW
ncbi:MAG TPA: hypothetical protein VFR21_22930 [Bradyrhizobium sp.]|jgi:hypothetical protein|nr:hypothetical protein [Bradyrhizobium sp.]